MICTETQMSSSIAKKSFLLQGENLETITSAIVAFFEAQPAMLDQIPNLGHVPKVFNAMTSRNDAIPKAALLVAHELAANDVIINIISSFRFIFLILMEDFCVRQLVPLLTIFLTAVNLVAISGCNRLTLPVIRKICCCLQVVSPQAGPM